MNYDKNLRLTRDVVFITLLLAVFSRPLLSTTCDQDPNRQQNLPPVYHNVPCGNADAPANGLTNQAGAINFGGWALSHIARVGIYRNPVGNDVPNFNGWVWIQDAVFIAGARPDIANAYPAYPNNNWATGHRYSATGCLTAVETQVTATAPIRSTLLRLILTGIGQISEMQLLG
jgi:hypothetical protein